MAVCLWSHAAELRAADRISVREHGAVCDDRVDDTVPIRATIEAAKAALKSVYFPPGDCVVSGPINVPENTEIFGAGRASRIRQKTWSLPVFEVGHDYPYIHDLFLDSTEGRQLINGSFQRAPARGRSAGVYSAESNFGRFENLFIRGFAVGISLRGPYQSTTTRNTGNSITNLEVEDVDQGVLSVQQEQHAITSIRSSKITKSQGVDPHLVYLSGLTPPGLKNVIVSGGSLKDGISSGFKSNGTQGLSLVDLICERCARGFDIGNSTGTGVGLRAIAIPSATPPDSQQGAFVFENADFTLVSPEATFAPGSAAFGISARKSSAITVLGGSFRAAGSRDSRPFIRTSGEAVVQAIRTTFETSDPEQYVIDLRGGGGSKLINPTVRGTCRLARVAKSVGQTKILIAKWLADSRCDLSRSISDAQPP